jgi:hypothetical protein
MSLTRIAERVTGMRTVRTTPKFEMPVFTAPEIQMPALNNMDIEGMTNLIAEVTKLLLMGVKQSTIENFLAATVEYMMLGGSEYFYNSLEAKIEEEIAKGDAWMIDWQIQDATIDLKRKIIQMM